MSFRIRSFDPEKDIPGLVTLRTEIEAVDQVGTNTSEAAVRAQMKWRGHDPARDRWVAFSPDAVERFLGHAWIFAQSPKRSILSVAVHPACRRKGLGSFLLHHALQRAGETGAVQVVSGTEANNAAGRAFLKHQNFSAVGHNRFLSAPENTFLQGPDWHTGFSVQSYEKINDLSILVKACNQCYQDMWGHRENTEPSTKEFYADMMKEDPDYFPPGGIFILSTPAQEAVGICFCRVEGGQKVIDSPAISPAFRQHDLLRPLILTAMHWLNAQAKGDFQLQTWGDSEQAVQTYTELGFKLNENDHVIEYLWNGKTTGR
jgi:ribosomal protein S18 acetylase RimI-like enzyme